MPDTKVTKDLFDRWELVWHEHKYDLVPSCVAPSYLRHDASGDRAVTAESYTDELKKMKATRPNVRVAVYDHIFQGNRAWFRFTFRWKDASTGEPQTQAGMQSYRIEDGKLAETWARSTLVQRSASGLQQPGRPLELTYARGGIIVMRLGQMDAILS